MSNRVRSGDSRLTLLLLQMLFLLLLPQMVLLRLLVLLLLRQQLLLLLPENLHVVLPLPHRRRERWQMTLAVTVTVSKRVTVSVGCGPHAQRCQSDNAFAVLEITVTGAIALNVAMGDALSLSVAGHSCVVTADNTNINVALAAVTIVVGGVPAAMRSCDTLQRSCCVRVHVAGDCVGVSDAVDAVVPCSAPLSPRSLTVGHACVTCCGAYKLRSSACGAGWRDNAVNWQHWWSRRKLGGLCCNGRCRLSAKKKHDIVKEIELEERNGVI